MTFANDRQGSLPASVIREVTGRAPDLGLRIIERLTLRVVAAETTEQRIHLDRTFEQYLETPRDLDEIVGRWASVIVGGTVQQDKLDPTAVVPIVKARRWTDSQRAYHVEQFGTDKAFSLCWETYNAELILVYAEFNSGLRFVRAEEVEANGLDMAALRHLATKNLAERTRELRIMGGGADVVVICAEGNLEPSLILLDEVWRDPRARVDGDRLVTIAERGFTITAGTARVSHGITLGLLKPAQILSLEIEPARYANWTDEERAKLLQAQNQGSLFAEAEQDIKLLKKVPFDFYYRYSDPSGAEWRHKISDWEAGALYWNVVRNHGEDWQTPFRKKLDREFLQRDLMFLMGTLHRFPDQWLIVSLVYPPKRLQQSLL